MLSTLNLKEGGILKIQSVHLSTGIFVKIQPQSNDFLDITDPRAV